ncbi:uroporphyrinogen-III synthase [Sphingomonas sp. S1-29]|uniref:uroporphyrinogen-III synthase n=1 Tax=Sphingomonas sp. S1-29 TaxID=2991074 RepID=UPI00224029BA|nr:uroporphyrinogen-III synthase [Sphingomonas sp. S1-29]UZK68807.1 uroporphyrinogen-III synthase [Sphingomonas sp. S1-29]
MLIWVTRTAPQNRATAKRLVALGHQVLVAPVLAVRGVKANPLRSAPDAIVFTSVNGVAHHSVDLALVSRPVFAVGTSTAEAAMRAGYLHVCSADGDVTDLQRLILDRLPPPARIVHFGAEELAGDMKGFLARGGYSVNHQVVYSSYTSPASSFLDIRKRFDAVDGIVIHSPRAAHQVAVILTGTGWAGRAWCISAACAHELADLTHLKSLIARRPTEEDLIKLIHWHGVVPLRAPLAIGRDHNEIRRNLDAAPEMSANDNADPSVPPSNGGTNDFDPPAA